MHFRISTIIICLIQFISLAPIARGQSSASREPIARVGQQVIYDTDLLSSIGGQLFQLESQQYELKSKELDKLVDQKLLDSAAKANGLSTEAFLQQTVYRNIPAPTAAEVEAFYLAQKDQLNRPFGEVKSEMEKALMEAKRQQARQEYVDKLRDQSSVAILLSPPRIDVAPDPKRMQGNPDAPVTIVEFSDFQCPYCRMAESTVKELLDKHRNNVRFSYRDFPLERIHPMAVQAAKAARCAGEQGKFWEYHDLLYANQESLDQTLLTENARRVGVDMSRFSTCLASARFEAPIEADLQAGKRSGVSGTPAFFINGIFLSGVQPLSEFERIIESELKAAESKRAAR